MKESLILLSVNNSKIFNLFDGQGNEFVDETSSWVIDPEKLKSRADRFGVSSLNEKSKKALRKERFGK